MHLISIKFHDGCVYFLCFVGFPYEKGCFAFVYAHHGRKEKKTCTFLCKFQSVQQQRDSFISSLYLK